MNIKIGVLVALSAFAVSPASGQSKTSRSPQQQGSHAHQGIQAVGTANYITKFTSRVAIGNLGIVEARGNLTTTESLTVGGGGAQASVGSSLTMQGYVLYDNFSSGHIDPSKWVGEPASLVTASDKDRREVAVEVVGEDESRRLRISETTYSAISDNDGSSGYGFGLGFANPSQITAVSFTLTVNKEKNPGCPGYPDNLAFTSVGFFGDYFNPLPPQNGQTGDIVVSTSVSNFSFNTGTDLEVAASISQCQDPVCAGQTTLSIQTLGYVKPGSTNTLSAKWDRANHQFVFGLNDNPPVALGYTVSDNFPPGSSDKSFFVFGQVPHCTAMPRPVASLDTLFGNVYVK